MVNQYVNVHSGSITSTNGGKRGGISIGFSYDKQDVAPRFSEEFMAAISRVAAYVDPQTKALLKDFNFTSAFNSWIGNYNLYAKQEQWKEDQDNISGGSRILRYKCSYECKFLGVVLKLSGYVSAYNLRDAKETISKHILLSMLTIGVAQMESAQGDPVQESDKANNTIVTRDAGLTTAIEQAIAVPRLMEICSTEPMHQFDSIVNRWMALPPISIDTNMAFNAVAEVYNLPSFLYTETRAPNMMPFENFLFGNYEIDFKFVVNANKFHVGKLMASVKYDSYQIDSLRNEVTTQLARPHVILDLSVNNEGILGVPFKFHRTFVRNVALVNSQFGSKAGQYATVVVSILSPLAAIAGAPQTMYVRPFYRIRKAEFTGMSYKVPLAQMEDVAKVGRVLENALKFVGSIPNMDKPYDSERVSQVVLRPRLNFQSGKGASDAVPMRVDPMTQTTFLPDHEYPEDPRTTIDVARIWGLVGSFSWNASSVEGAELYSQLIEPTWRLRSTTDIVPTPLEYVASMYQYWSGPLEIRLDFVSNAFHTGSIMLSAEFGRSSSVVEESSSTYTKVFHLGEQKSVTFTIPYIYDTVWRRCSTVPFCPIQDTVASNQRLGANALIRENSSSFKIRVINRLVPVTSVVQNIRVLVFIRGGANFTLHSPIQANFLYNEPVWPLSDFPANTPLVSTNALARTDLPSTMREGDSIQISHKWLKGKLPKDAIAQSTSFKEEKIKLNPDVPLGETTDLLDKSLKKVIPQSGYVPEPRKDKPYQWYSSRTKKLMTYVPGVLPPGEYDYLYFPAIDQSDKDNDYWDNSKLIAYKYDKVRRTIKIGDSNFDLFPYAQMDSGDKEDLDPTYNFSQGVARTIPQTVESHVNIKDLLRRPICIIKNRPVTLLVGPTNQNLYYLPCLPPSAMLMRNSNPETVNREYAAGLSYSHHALLLNMFRFWRGSQRYTIVSYRSTGAPIYVSYMPHAGAMLTGNQALARSSILGESVVPGSVGLATEMIIPSVNPSGAIEVPFEMEENWALMMCENWARNFSWRDKGDYNAGHIVIWSEEAFNMDVWWSAGDDFQVANFLGPPRCESNYSSYYLTDNHPTAQMEDFQPRDTAEQSVFSRVLNSVGWSTAVGAATAIPVVGMPVATAMVGARLDNVARGVEQATDRITHTASRFENLAESCNDVIAIIKSKLMGVVDTASSLYNVIVNGIIDLLMNMGTWNPKNIALTFLRLVTNALSIPIMGVMRYLTPLSEFFGMNPVAQAGDSTEQLSGSFWSEDKVKDAFKLLCAIVASISNVVITTPITTPWNLVKRILLAPLDIRSLSYVSGIIRFSEVLFSVFKESILWVVSQVSPEARALSQLRMESKYVDEFITECQILTNECNKGSMLLPSFRLRYWANVIRAYDIQRKLVSLPNARVSNVLSRWCSDMIKQGKENMADLRSSPVKYEPFVLCITGTPGIGKSMLVHQLAHDMLKSIGIEKYPGDPIYYRISGSRYWNGYSDQPVVVYDDWMNITEPTIMAQVLNELYQLKSSATFIPEQAAIEEKKIKATPRIVILLCNSAFPDSALTNGVTDKDAVYRRRDLLVEARRKETYVNKDLRTLTAEESENCEHLEFVKFGNVCDFNSKSTKAVGYKEFSEYVLGSFRRYDKQELINVQTRMQRLTNFFATVSPAALRDPFSIFYEGMVHADLTSSERLPSQALQDIVQTLSVGLEDVQIVQSDVPDAPPNPWSQSLGEAVVLMSLGTLAVATPWLIKKIINRMYTPEIQSDYTGECAVCCEQAVLTKACAVGWVNTAGSNPHAVCDSCYHRLVLNGPWKCPVCRNDQPPLSIITEESLQLVLGIIKNRGLPGIIGQGVNALSKFLASPQVRAVLTLMNGTLAAYIPYLLPYGNYPIAQFVLAQGACLTLSQLLMKVTKWTNVDPNGTLDMDIGVPQPKHLPIYEAWDEDSTQLFQRIQEWNASEHDLVQRQVLIQELERLTRRRVANVKETKPFNGEFILPNLEYRRDAFFVEREAWIDTWNRSILRGDIDDEILPLYSDIMNRRSSQEITDRNNEIITRRARRFLDYRRMVIAQSPGDGEEIEYAPLQGFNHWPTLDANDLLDYKINENKLRCLAVESEYHPTCLHKLMEERPDVIRFHASKYIIETRQGNIDVPKTACATNPECPLLDDVRREAMFREWFEAKKDVWFTAILAMPADERVARIKQLIPEWAWPGWIAMEPHNVDLSEIESDTWWDYITLPNALKALLGAAAMGVVILTTIRSIQWMMGFIAPQAEIVPSGSEIIRHFRPAPRRINRTAVEAQSETQDAIINKVSQNYFVIFVQHGNEILRRLCGVGIKQRLGLIPKHFLGYLRRMKQDVNVSMYIARSDLVHMKVPFVFDESMLMISTTADICVLQLPASFNMFKDITKYMASDVDLNRRMANTGVVVTPRTAIGGYSMVIPVNILGYVQRQYIMSEDGGYYSNHCLQYTYSKKGACGSLVLKDHSQRPIVALHIAGMGEETSGKGYGVILTGEMFAEIGCAISAGAKEYGEIPEAQSIETMQIHLPHDSVVDYVGVLPRDKTPFAPYKSRIRKSLIHDDLPWKSTKAPAILSQKDDRYAYEISPLVAGCAKHGYLTYDFKQEHLEEIADLRYQQLLTVKPSIVPCEKLTIQEAVVGLPAIPFYDPLHLDTSAGWPWCTTKKTLKGEYCKVERDGEGNVTQFELDQDIIDAVDKDTQMRQQGTVVPTVFVDTLKDEKVGAKKIEKLGGTRVFCASPFQFSIAMRQNFLHFTAAYAAHRWDINHAVGINLQGPQCTELVSRLLEKGNNIVTIDYSNFGPGFNAGVAWAAYRNIKRWILDNVKNVNEAELDCLAEENFNSLHAMHSTLYRQRAGSPSGSPVTVVINSEVNNIYVMLAWDKICQEPNKWAEWREHVCLYVYGDDLIMSVSDKWIKEFNAVTISNYFKEHNIVATDASKEETIIPYTTIDKASFLKCTFWPHPHRPGQWLAKLAQESLFDTPLWIHESIEFKEATRLNAEAGIKSAYGWGKDYHDWYRDTINKALASKGMEPILSNWRDLDINFYGEMPE